MSEEDERFTPEENGWYDNYTDEFISTDEKETLECGQAFMDDMAEDNPGWVTGEESD